MKNEEYLSDLRKAFARSRTISSYAKAVEALQGPNRDALRFTAWNIILGVLGDNKDRWECESLMHFNWYWNIVSQFFNSCSYWLHIQDSDMTSPGVLPVDSKQTMFCIHNDVVRTCTSMARTFSPGKLRIDTMNRRIERILYIISQYSPEMGYIQGFDRYALILFILAKDFCDSNKLPLDFAEAFAYAMTYRFIMKVRYHKFMGSEEQLLDWMENYKNILNKFQPEVSTYIEHMGISHVQYVFRWVALIFADEHSSYDLMLIWDKCLIHLDDLHMYVFCMSVAHVTQVYNTCHENKSMPEMLNRYRDWDMPLLLRKTDEYYRNLKTPENKSSCCGLF